MLKTRTVHRIREWTSGLLGVCGFVLLASWACGEDYSIWLRDQLLLVAGGAALIGLAYLVYPEKRKRPVRLASRKAQRKKDQHQDNMGKEALSSGTD